MTMKEELATSNKISQIATHISDILSILGIKDGECLENTPLRVAKMYCHELLRNVTTDISELDKQMKLFPHKTHEWLIEKDVEITVPVKSVCAHHLMPFIGSVKITYKPNDCIIGLSKIPRVVDFFSRKPQLQENLTAEIGEYLFNLLNPEYLDVMMTCEHTCVSMRGPEVPCSTTTHWRKVGEDFE